MARDHAKEIELLTRLKNLEEFHKDKTANIEDRLLRSQIKLHETFRQLCTLVEAYNTILYYSMLDYVIVSIML